MTTPLICATLIILCSVTRFRWAGPDLEALSPHATVATMGAPVLKRTATKVQWYRC